VRCALEYVERIGTPSAFPGLTSGRVAVLVLAGGRGAMLASGRALHAYVSVSPAPPELLIVLSASAGPPEPSAHALGPKRNVQCLRMKNIREGQHRPLKIAKSIPHPL